MWPQLDQLRVTVSGIVVYPPGASLPRRCLADYQFIWILEGDAVAYFDDQPLEVSSGSLLLRRPHMTDRYEWAAEQRTVHAFIHFHALLPAEGWPASHTWPLVRTPGHDEISRPLFRYILNQHRQADAGSDVLTQPALELLLRAFICGKLGLGSEPHLLVPPAVERALRYVQHVTFCEQPRGISLRELSGEAHVTPEHLCRLFRASLNRGPLEFVRLARMQFCAELLQRTTMSVKEIADAGGFANPYHFSRLFRKTYSLAPSQYRKRVIEGKSVPANPIIRTLTMGMGDLLLGDEN